MVRIPCWSDSACSPVRERLEEGETALGEGGWCLLSCWGQKVGVWGCGISSVGPRGVCTQSPSNWRTPWRPLSPAGYLVPRLPSLPWEGAVVFPKSTRRRWGTEELEAGSDA